MEPPFDPPPVEEIPLDVDVELVLVTMPDDVEELLVVEELNPPVDVEELDPPVEVVEENPPVDELVEEPPELVDDDVDPPDEDDVDPP